MNKRAFSFVELIIVVSILALLGIIVYSVNNTVKQNTINTRITADLDTIKTSLMSYKADKEELPLPTGNLNNFKSDSTYSHDGIDVSNTEAFGTFGKITEATLPKAYLSSPVQDPRTNNFYSYGITADKQLFEIAGVVAKEDYFVAALSGTYRGEGGPVSLIREYNGAKFIKDGKATLPYNPYEQVVTVTDQDGKVYDLNKEIVAPAGKDLTLYFSDGSISLLKAGSSIMLKNTSLVKDNGLITKIELTLNAGTLWTKASRLFTNGESKPVSSFEVSTSDTTAAVRGTIFCIGNSCPGGETVVVIEGEVEVTNGTEGTGSIDDIPEFATDTTSTIDKNTVTTENIPTQEEIDDAIAINTETENTQIVETIDTSHCIKLPDNDCYTETKKIANDNGKEEEYQLVAYAPYDIGGDLKMYSQSTINMDQNQIFNNTYSLPSECVTNNSFCEVGETKGIFIGSEDSLQYNISELNLGEDFVIEIRAKIDEGQSSDGFYLFDLDENINLYNNYGNGFTIDGSPENKFDIFNNKFHTFIVTVTESKAILSVKETEIVSDDSLENITSDKLTIGANHSPEGYYDQINNIIDYVKIYKSVD